MESLFERRPPTTKQRLDSAARTIYALRHVPFHELIYLLKNDDESELTVEERFQGIAILGSVSAAVTVAQNYLAIPEEEDES